MEQIQCIPQDDFDCYYNSIWKKKHSNTNMAMVTNFSIIQQSIDNFFYNFITSDQMGLSNVHVGNIYTHHNIHHNMVTFRDSYYARQDDEDVLVGLYASIINIKNFEELTIILAYMTQININIFFDFSIVSNFKYPPVYILKIDEITLK